MRVLRQIQLLTGAVWPVRTLIPGGGAAAWAQLPRILRPEPAALRDPDFLRLHLAVRLGVGVMGAAVLLRGGTQGAGWRRSLGEGLAQYELPDWPEPFWVDVRSHTAKGGWGTPPRAFGVRVRFTDALQALRAQTNELDFLAEIGAGWLLLEGRLPLVDGLHLVMNEVENLLEGP